MYSHTSRSLLVLCGVGYVVLSCLTLLIKLVALLDKGIEPQKWRWR